MLLLSVFDPAQHSIPAMQVVSEVFHRMANVEEYPSQLAAEDCWTLDTSLQCPASAALEPTAPFPSAGALVRGQYQGRACDGCYIKVGTSLSQAALPLMAVNLCPQAHCMFRKLISEPSRAGTA